MALHEGFREILCYEVLQNALNVVFKEHLISAPLDRGSTTRSQRPVHEELYLLLAEGCSYD
jgi:hypothetical protein